MSRKKMSNLKQVFDTDGNLMYEGKASSLKAFVEQCVRSGKSMAKANLRGLDLMHLDLSRGNFAEACFDGAKLRGSKLNGAVFIGASMKGVSASGVDAVSAVFTDVDFSPYEYEKAYDDGRVNPDGSPMTKSVRQTSDFIGAMLTYAIFNGAREIEVDFTQSAMSSSIHTGAHCRRSVYKDAYLHNADWAGAKIIGNVFDGANMTPRMKNVSEAHLPDRTKDALVVGNSYKDAEFGSGNRGFVMDAFAVGKIRLATLGLVASGLFVATAAIPFDLEGALSNVIGKTATFVIAASALTWIKTPIEDFFKDKAIEFFAETAVKVRSSISEMWRRGKAISSLAVALMTRDHADQVQKVLESKAGSCFERIKAAAKGKYDVVVCDREHLAEALSRISEMMNNMTRQKHSVILVRMGQSTDDVPRAVVINGDSGMEALWDQGADGNIRHKAWDVAKFPLPDPGSVGPQRFMGPYNSHLQVVSKFMNSILAESGLQDFKVRHQTHFIRQGKDGSIVVVRQKDGRLDNMGAPTVITPDDRRLYFRNSTAYDERGQRLRDQEPDASPLAFGMR